ncbi:hypothetical protein GO986_21750 [Deinococcus sp. HMF7620]|uniref:Uncharacterized protein n=1 Tax=Deinococcus arboris TaxID=2682977 RepID=A0A7C9MBT4_9DEIO|nr:hypothetical protein [Deinococcus arboris]MVN89363.1 hypothetical protein [Deinococcus arboris]
MRPSIVVFRVLLDRVDSTTDELGHIEMQAADYGTTASDAAMPAALAELTEAPGGLLRWRGHAFPGASLRALRVEVVSEYLADPA